MFFRVLFLVILASHIFEVVFTVHVDFHCLCLKCSVEDVAAPCDICSAHCAKTVPKNCTRDFRVSINSTGSDVEESMSVTLTCLHDLPEQINVTYEWKKKESDQTVARGRQYKIKKAFSEHVGSYICIVRSMCGNYTSEPHDVTVHNNNIIILVICGCAALTLVVIMGVCMKIKMRRDKIKNHQRTQQRLQDMRRAQDLQNRAPLPLPKPT